MNGSYERHRMMVFAHRGASGAAPENTLAAFQQAIEKGADGVELDVRLTSDGKAVVIHDPTINRTSDGKGEVSSMSYNVLRSFNMAAKWKGSDWGVQRIPLLEEVIDCVVPSGLTVNIELKGAAGDPRLAEEAARVVRERRATDNVIFSSFDPYQLQVVGGLLPGSRRAILCFLPYPARRAKAEGYWGCHPHYLLTGRAAIDSYHSEGLYIQLWTVNTKPDLKRALSMKADGVITNHPAIAVAIREGRLN